MISEKNGIFIAVFVLALLAALPMRTCLILFYIDPSTGFYNGSTGLATALNILLIVATVILLLPMFMKIYRNLEAAPAKSRQLGILSTAAALFFLIEAIHNLYQLVSSAGGTGVFLNAVCAFASAGFFALFGIAYLKGSQVAFPAAALLPVIWATLHLMIAFMHYTTVVNISEYLFDMLKMVFVMLFFYYHSRYAGRVSNGSEVKGMIAFGLPAVLFCLVSTLPRYIALPFRHSITFDLPEDLLFIALGVYIAATIWSVLPGDVEEEIVESAIPTEPGAE